MNEKNLRPFTKGENAKENGRMGGIASGEARREKRSIRDFLSDFLDCEISSDKGLELLTEFEQEHGTHAAAVAMRLIKNAIEGDVKAVRLLLETTGELEKSKVSVQVNADIQKAYEDGKKQGHNDVFGILTDKELITIIARLDGKEELPPEEERPVFTPDGRLIIGESELQD